MTISDSAAESLEDQIVEGDMAEIVESIGSFAACSVAEAAQSFDLPESGYLEAVKPGSHVTYPVVEETDSELADLAGIPVEIGDFSWSVVLFTRWEGCVNVALEWELARMLYFWNKRWGMELVALSEDTEATMLVRVGDPGGNREEIVATLAAAGDELVVIPGPDGLPDTESVVGLVGFFGFGKKKQQQPQTPVIRMALMALGYSPDIAPDGNGGEVNVVTLGDLTVYFWNDPSLYHAQIEWPLTFSQEDTMHAVVGAHMLNVNSSTGVFRVDTSKGHTAVVCRT